MIVEAIRVRKCEHGIDRSARVRWSSGESVLRIVGPAGLADETPDASGFLCAALPLAMRNHEDLRMEGPVSPELLRSCEAIQFAYAAWDPELEPVDVIASHAADRAIAPAPGSAAFFSRGVDSTFAAARDRAGPRSLTHLIFADRLDPDQDERVRAEEIRRAEAVAGRLELPLVVVETNLRQLTDPILPGWEDYVAAALSFLAHALAGGLGRALIPSGDSYETIEPCGTTPLLDPLFRTERLVIEHDVLTHSRSGKVGWLARERPDLLEQLKVCFGENRPDNCGRCGKCLLTMVGLRAAGALHLATQFPDAIDLDAVRRLRMRRFKSRMDWLDACRRLDSHGADGELRRAILERMREVRLIEPAVESEQGLLWFDPRSFRDHRLNATLSLLLDGRPYPPFADAPPLELLLGLVRGIDRGGARHVYAVGTLPEGEIAGELGALRHAPDRASIPVWVTWDGQLVAQGVGELPATGPARRTRWALAPLGWRDFPGRGARARAVGWRLRRMLAPPIRPAPALGEPAGFLHRDPGPRRLPLYAGRHPVTGDQLLATRPHEANELGYVGIAVLGYLDAEAPVTGKLGVGRPWLPWASRFGQRITE